LVERSAVQTDVFLQGFGEELALIERGLDFSWHLEWRTICDESGIGKGDNSKVVGEIHVSAVIHRPNMNKYG